MTSSLTFATTSSMTSARAGARPRSRTRTAAKRLNIPRILGGPRRVRDVVERKQLFVDHDPRLSAQVPEEALGRRLRQIERDRAAHPLPPPRLGGARIVDRLQAEAEDAGLEGDRGRDLAGLHLAADLGQARGERAQVDVAGR